MTLESNIVNEIKFLQFNDEKARNAISAEDWINLQEEIESFENSDLKYLVIKHINGNYSAGAQLGETVSALMDDVCLLYTSPSPRDRYGSRMPSSA